MLQFNNPKRLVTAAGTIAAVVASVSVALWVTGYATEAALGLGFIPARVLGVELPPEIASLPWWLTPLSAILIYLHPLELFFSLAILVLIGNGLEKLIGARAMVGLYLFAAYPAALAQFVANPASSLPLIGATGPIAALIGAYAMLHVRPRHGVVLNPWVQAAWLSAAWAAISLGLALAGGFDWAANIGGFVAGVALARPLLAWRWRKA